MKKPGRSILNLPRGLLLAWLLIVTTSSLSQSVVSGSVTHTNESFLVGVTIRNLSTGVATSTDSSGSFRIEGKRGELLEFSHIGFATHQIKLRDETILRVVLEEEAIHLNEVVTIGYGTAKRKDLTGAISSIAAREFNKGIYPSPEMLMQGKIAGLQLTANNGQPGGSVQMKIRGNSALSGSGQPLFVVDGVLLDGRSLQPGSNPLSFINPEDVSSIDVLKDASATAIYGSRAAYGVIIITTKKGQAGQAKIDFSAAIGVASMLKKIQVLNAGEYRDALRYYNAPLNFDEGGNTDALDEILRQGVQQNYSVAMNSGNETSKYRLSFHHTDQDGIVRNTGFRKYSVDFSGQFNFLRSGKLGFDVNVIASQHLQNVPLPGEGASRIIRSALEWNPTKPLKNADGTIRLIPGDQENPLALTDLVKNSLKVNSFLGVLSPYYKFNDWLEYKLVYGVNSNMGISRSSIHQSIFQPFDPVGTASVSNREMLTHQLSQTLTFDKKLSDRLKVRAVAGVEYMSVMNKGASLSAVGVSGTGFGNFGLDYTNYLQYSSVSQRSVSSFIDPTSSITSYLARVMFDWQDKYLLTATARVDGSSKFGSNNKYAWFPSFGVAWNIDKEEFFKPGFINRIKFRAGWGKTGNQEFPTGSAQARYAFRDNGVIIQVNSPNADLKWQSDKQYNIAIDFAIFNNRISGTIDYFNKSTTNLLYPSVPIQPSPPSSVIRWVNLDGKIINRGLELAVNAALVRRPSVALEIAANATLLNNNVVGMPKTILTGALQGPGVSFTTVEVIANDLPMNAFVTRRFTGIDKSSGLSTYETSDTSFYYVGNPNPDALVGFSTAFRYKQFSFTTAWYGAFGQDIYFNTLMNAINVGGIAFGKNISLDEYRAPARESLYNPATPSSRFIIKGNYLKLSNVTITYEFSKTSKVLKRSSIYISGQNLLLFTKYPGFDPESNFDGSQDGIPSLGIDYVQYPSSRLFVLGINISM